ncbi:MAG: HAD hydrolase family protein, partial [Dehalococcoidia bacterium]
RRYMEELTRMGATYDAARSIDIDRLSRRIEDLRALPLAAVGSGGSLTACHFAARLHEVEARQPGRVLTPLEFVRLPPLHSAGVLLISSGGGNRDILAAARHAAATEYRELVGLCARRDTALAAVLASARHATVIEFDNPAGKDGFLATNSLVLTCSLLARAYGTDLPTTLPSLDEFGVEGDPQALRRRSLLILAGGWAAPAAADFESKWGEAGIGTVTVLDARNFAHGRHFGISRRSADTAVIGLATAEESDTLRRTMRTLPDSIAQASVLSPLPGPVGALDLLMRVIRLAGTVAQADGLDPGRPRVPSFGRQLYRAGIPLGTGARRAKSEDLWIRRKVTPLVWDAVDEATRQSWRRRAKDWAYSAERTAIGGVVFDYDGTLCEADERLGPLPEAIAVAIRRIHEIGLSVGVATGRGGSVIEALRATLPCEMWESIWVGMYNGARIQRLHEPAPEHGDIHPSVQEAFERISSSPALAPVARLTLQPTQVCVRDAVPLPSGLLQRFVVEALLGCEEVDVRCSGHTVDVIARRVSKLAVVERVRAAVGSGLAIVTIGDQGQAHGNDESFLAHPLGLSVEQASSRFDGCWNVAPAGSRRTSALLGYLEGFHPTSTGIRWRIRPGVSPRSGVEPHSEEER